jgi:hypothetical protein
MLAHTEWRIALEHHLQYNCYPPVSLEWLDAADAAVSAVVECQTAEELNEVTVTGPDGSEYRALYLVQALHLEAFVNSKLESEVSDG